jgi:hypothetical protein
MYQQQDNLKEYFENTSPVTTTSVVRFSNNAYKHMSMLHNAILYHDLDQLWFTVPLFVKTMAIASNLKPMRPVYNFKQKSTPSYIGAYNRLTEWSKRAVCKTKPEPWWEIETDSDTDNYVDSALETSRYIVIDQDKVIMPRCPMYGHSLLDSEETKSLFSYIFKTLLHSLDEDMDEYLDELFELPTADCNAICMFIYYTASRFWGDDYHSTIGNYSGIVRNQTWMAYENTDHGDKIKTRAPLHRVVLDRTGVKYKTLSKDTIAKKINVLLEYSCPISLHELKALEAVIRQNVNYTVRHGSDIDLAVAHGSRFGADDSIVRETFERDGKHNLWTAENRFTVKLHDGYTPVTFELSLRATFMKAYEWITRAGRLNDFKCENKLKLSTMYSKLLKSTPLFDYPFECLVVDDIDKMESMNKKWKGECDY